MVEIEIEPDGAWVQVWSSVAAVDNTLVISPGNYINPLFHNPTDGGNISGEICLLIHAVAIFTTARRLLLWCHFQGRLDILKQQLQHPRHPCLPTQGCVDKEEKEGRLFPASWKLRPGGAEVTKGRSRKGILSRGKPWGWVCKCGLQVVFSKQKRITFELQNKWCECILACFEPSTFLFLTVFMCLSRTHYVAEAGLRLAGIILPKLANARLYEQPYPVSGLDSKCCCLKPA